MTVTEKRTNCVFWKGISPSPAVNNLLRQKHKQAETPRFDSILKYKARISVTISDTTCVLTHIPSAHPCIPGMAMKTGCITENLRKYNLIATCLSESCISRFLL